jgi:hypothetical protein
LFNVAASRPAQITTTSVKGKGGGAVNRAQKEVAAMAPGAEAAL